MLGQCLLKVHKVDYEDSTFIFKLCVYMHVCMICAHECSAPGRQKKVSEPLELELEEVVICPVWVPVPQLRPTARAMHTLTHCANSLALQTFLSLD